MEVWKPCPLVDGYEASTWGRIKKTPHVRPMPKGGKRLYGGKARHGVWDKDKKRYVLQYKGKTYRVARMVAWAFHGPAPFPKAVVMHLDEDPRNNRPENLKWGTQRENLNAPGFVEYCRSRTGDRHPRVRGRT